MGVIEKTFIIKRVLYMQLNYNIEKYEFILYNVNLTYRLEIEYQLKLQLHEKGAETL